MSTFIHYLQQVCLLYLFVHVHLFVLLDLHHFLTLVTGTRYLTSKGISVDFTSTDYDPQVAV